MTTRRTLGGFGALGAALAAWWALHGAPPQQHRLHAKAATEAAEGLHHSVIGAFTPPKPGEVPNAALLEMESAGDKVFTIAASDLPDLVQAYDDAPTPAEKARLAGVVHELLARIRAELPKFAAATDPLIVGARTDLTTALDQIAKDVP